MPSPYRRKVLLISIHALREEGDPTVSTDGAALGRFLSTPSARRATRVESKSKMANYYFYPRPPRGGRPSGIFGFAVWLIISIHALREEGDK